eukprot:gene3795-13864_t
MEDKEYGHSARSMEGQGHGQARSMEDTGLWERSDAWRQGGHGPQRSEHGGTRTWTALEAWRTRAMYTAARSMEDKDMDSARSMEDKDMDSARSMEDKDMDTALGAWRDKDMTSA